MYCELLPLLGQDVLLVTANLRLTEYLLRDFNYAQDEQFHRAWLTPHILPLNSWLSTLWQQHPHSDGLLISELEENLLWQNIILADDETNTVLQLNQAVQLAKSAWQTLQLWQKSIDDIKQHPNAEVAKFINFTKQFITQKNKLSLHSQAELPALICDLIRHEAIKLPPTIIFYGFDQLPPAVEKLIEALQTKTKVHFFEFDEKNLTTQRLGLKDEEAEIRAMAQWAKDKLDSLHPREKIGCVCPSLNQKRNKILRIFTEVFSPDKIHTNQARQATPYNISVGKPLAHYLIIRTALDLLAVRPPYISIELMTRFFLSPYVNSTPDDRALAAISAHTAAQEGEQHVLLSSLQTTLIKYNQVDYPQTTFAARWSNFSKCKTSVVKARFATWVMQFQDRLNSIGWPGQKSLSSFEYQVVQCWQSVLENLTHLDRILPPVSQEHALYILNKSAAETIFQPQSEDKPIQILGILEAAGCRFQSLWVMGLDNETWPAKATPNPFLPIEFQRQLNMPHSSAERELEFAKRTQRTLQRLSQHVIFSYSESNEDKLQRPSQLICAAVTMTAPPSRPYKKPAFLPIESINDSQAAAVTETENIRGGSWILKEQSRCPFRAFATIRLQAKRNEPIALGLSAKKRGILTHKVLDLIWKQLKTQKQLLSLTNSTQLSLIQHSIAQAIKAADLAQHPFISLESQRLTKLITHWLEVEKNRPPFNVIARETSRQIMVNALPLRIQIDRIDQLSDGTQLVIDYKTGKYNSLTNWFGERIREPQLPLYALYGSDSCSGIAYAEVNLGKLNFVGLSAPEQQFSKIAPWSKYVKTWQALQQHWQMSLNLLAHEFMAGYASVTPQQPNECVTCHLTGVCRIGEHL